MKYTLGYSCYTHIGNLRTANQDNFICNGIHENPNPCYMPAPLTGCVNATAIPLFGVFDGLGGEECGEVASFLAAQDAANHSFAQHPQDSFLAYCQKANNTICQYATEQGVTAMGTTAAMLLFTPKGITLCNIGDSKIFRLRQNQLDQLSTDHLAVAPFGRKPPLSQNLGIPPQLLTIEPYVATLDCKHNDTYLLCSDGITDMIPTTEILEILQTSLVEFAATNLISKALEKGGRDNATAIVLNVTAQKPSLFSWFSR